MYADKSLLYEEGKVFGGIFNEWRVKRVRKLEYLFGQEWFKNKKILELGCGFGNVGLYLATLGSVVTFADARQEALDVVMNKNSSVELLLLNQETPWSLNRKFDLILHFGLLYNLDNWETDLYRTVHHAQFIALETAVSRFSGRFESKIVHPHYPQEIYGPYSGVGTLVSSANIEDVFNKLRAEYCRYDDKDLNMNANWDEFRYDWPEDDRTPETSGKVPAVNDWDSAYLGGRRFWLVRNKLFQLAQDT
jgi:SAM-dependent methyltransferase